MPVRRESDEVRATDVEPLPDEAAPEPAVPEPVGLGEAVRAACAGAGMTVEQVSARTKIPPAVLREFEAGSTARAGGSAYARGHLRAVAAVTGADPAVLLAAHDRTVAPAPVPVLPARDGKGLRRPGSVAARRPGPGPSAAAGQTAAGQTAAGQTAADRTPANRTAAGSAAAPALTLPRPAREQRGPRWGPAGAGAGVVLVALLLIGLTRSGDTPAALQAAVPTPVETTAPAPAPAPLPAAQLRLRVTGTSSWVQIVSAAGTSLFSGTLTSGTMREFTDPSSLRVVVGNAAAVAVTCGDTDAPPGARGTVRRWTCAPGGITAS